MCERQREQRGQPAGGEAPTNRFAEFAQDLCEPGTKLLSPQRLAQRLHLSIEEVAARARMHRNSATRASESEALQAYMRKVIRVLSAAFETNGGSLVGAVEWFRNQPIPDLGHKTADALVSEGKTDAVLAYIESIASGHVG